MIKLYNQLNIFVFKSSPVSIKAIVGKNGWFFMSGEEIKTYNGTALFTEGELNALKHELVRRKQIIELQHAHFLFAIVPNKSNIYPEYMPDYITGSIGYGKQLLMYLQKNNFPVIDLYTPLLNSKITHPIYYKTDNHWNDYGAFIASNVMLNEFKKYNNRVTPLSLTTYKPLKTVEAPGNIARMFSLGNESREINYVPTRAGGFVSKEEILNTYSVPAEFAYPEEYQLARYTNYDSLPNVLIIRDSFGKKPFPYISEQCKKCVAIYDAWHYGLNEAVIQGEQPDIVLLMVVESNLKNIMKYMKLESR